MATMASALGVGARDIIVRGSARSSASLKCTRWGRTFRTSARKVMTVTKTTRSAIHNSKRSVSGASSYTLSKRTTAARNPQSSDDPAGSVMGNFELPRREKANRGVRTAALPDDVDWTRIRSYFLATLVQFGLIAATLKALDFVFPKISWKFLSQISLPMGLSTASWPVVAKHTAVFLFFLYMSFRSRVFSPLDNKRPTVSSETKEIQQRKRPNWMPPPLAFPFIWGTIGILRAASSLVVWKAVGGKFLAWPFLVFLGHLCVGDTWNTINNVDKEYGVAALSMIFVVSSVYCADYAYFQVSQKAGFILAPSCLWISIASFLVFSIWRMNLPRASLYPKKKQVSS